MSTILCTVAHPDDEIFIGASLARFASDGHRVYVLALADGETSRIGAGMKAVLDRECKQEAAAKILGRAVIPSPRFADQRLDMVPLLDITRVIEAAVAQTQPSIVYTHSPGDLNADHRRVYEAVLPAIRPKSGVRSVYTFCGPAMLRPFYPTSFVEVTEAQMAQQHEALLCYGDELTAEWPLMQARAVEGGYRVGTTYAQGFEVIRECN